MNNEDRWTRGERVPTGRESRGRQQGWERSVIEKLATETLREQRRSRRWGIFFKLLAFGYVAVAMLMAYGKGLFDFALNDAEQHTAVVDVSGVIAAGEQASAERIIAGVTAAFESEDAAGVLLRINSPGGSPVQAGRVVDELRRLKAEYPEKPLIAVVEELCASGGYYIASVADEIYADKASLVGSIGVVHGGFGFVDALDKLGVERRIFTAGENKAFLDPFNPLKASEVAHWEDLLAQIHEQFKEVVRAGRGDALADDEELFTGLMWTGEQAVSNGLIDGLGSESTVAREVLGAEKVVNYTPTDGLLKQLTDDIGMSLTNRVFNRLTTPQWQP
jgi:protease-4